MRASCLCILIRTIVSRTSTYSISILQFEFNMYGLEVAMEELVSQVYLVLRWLMFVSECGLVGY